LLLILREHDAMATCESISSPTARIRFIAFTPHLASGTSVSSNGSESIAADAGLSTRTGNSPAARRAAAGSEFGFHRVCASRRRHVRECADEHGLSVARLEPRAAGPRQKPSAERVPLRGIHAVASTR
jgi:hypothetical protein